MDATAVKKKFIDPILTSHVFAKSSVNPYNINKTKVQYVTLKHSRLIIVITLY